MSIYNAGLLLEAIFLKARCLQVLGRFKEATQTSKIILDIVESSIPEGLPQNFGDFDLVALKILRKLLSSNEDPKHVPALLVASKICCENPDLAKDGASLARRVIENLDKKCDQLEETIRGTSIPGNSKQNVIVSPILSAQKRFMDAKSIVNGALDQTGIWKKLYKDYMDHAMNMELEIWHALANVYLSLSQWHGAEVCLSKSKAIKPYSASRCHAIGK
ncbi:hypothetical protein RJT34_20007 [Clitoria ternatea]|uniref:Uncharacterized protein n=1 Tax=Clitoria ternatea TaxID=43366 RepID=A0AAN9P4D9_CLITE